MKKAKSKNPEKPEKPKRKRKPDDWTTDEGHGVNKAYQWFNMPLFVRLAYGADLVDDMDGNFYPCSDNEKWHYEPDPNEESVWDGLEGR